MGERCRRSPEKGAVWRHEVGGPLLRGWGLQEHVGKESRRMEGVPLRHKRLLLLVHSSRPRNCQWKCWSWGELQGLWLLLLCLLLLLLEGVMVVVVVVVLLLGLKLGAVPSPERQKSHGISREIVL
mgnify:CR=1 FL=1